MLHVVLDFERRICFGSLGAIKPARVFSLIVQGILESRCPHWFPYIEIMMIFDIHILSKVSCFYSWAATVVAIYWS